MRSHPMWVRGLKRPPRFRSAAPLRSHPMWVRGLKQLDREDALQDQSVAPYVGAWIETLFLSQLLRAAERRTLCGCVD